MLTYEMLENKTFNEKDLSKKAYIPKSKFGEFGLVNYLHMMKNISYYGMWSFDSDKIELILVRNPEWVYNQFKNGETKEIESDWYFWSKSNGK